MSLRRSVAEDQNGRPSVPVKLIRKGAASFKQINKMAEQIAQQTRTGRFVIILDSGSLVQERYEFRRGHRARYLPHVVDQIEAALRVMRQEELVVDYSQVRTRWDGEVAFHEIDVYIPEAFWLDDGDIEVTARLLELQTSEDLISPYVHPAQAERVV